MFSNKSHIFIILLSLISSFFACEKNDNSYAVKGKLANVTDTVFFAARETNDSIFIDTIRIDKKGEFSFQGYVDTLTIISLYFKENQASPYFLVDKGWKVEVSGDVLMPDLIEVKGGAINDELTAFKKANANILKTRKELVKVNSQQEEVSDSTENKDDAVEMKNLDFDLKNIASDYVKNNPSKISSVIILDNFFKNEESIERLSQGLDLLEGAAYDFPLAIQLREYRDKIKKSAINAYAPFFSVKDEKDNLVTLSSMRGKYVLINFVSSTCKSCNEMLPEFIKEYDKIKKNGKNVEMITFVKDIEERELTIAELKPVKWPVIPVFGGWSAEIFADYNIKQVPYIILVSPEGKILERNVPLYNLETKLDSYPNVNKKKEEQKIRNNRFKRN